MPAESTASSSLDQEARLHYDAALKALTSNDLNQAGVEIQQALVRAPDHSAVLSMAGRIYTRQRSFGLASTCWRRLLSAYPGSATVRAEWGATLLYMGKDDEARSQINAALEASPGDLTARYYQGMQLVKDREFQRAAENFAVLNGPQVLQTITRLQEDRPLVVALSSTEGYRNLVRALLQAKTGDDTETVLAEVKRLLMELQPAMQAGQWAKAEPLLQALHKTGARFPALEYDLALCQYSLQPGPQPLDAMEALVVSPRGAGFRRLFVYLCLSAEEAARADRAAGESLKNDADPEALLLRAAIRQGLGDEAKALGPARRTVPSPPGRPPRPWFERRLAFIQQLAQSPPLRDLDRNPAKTALKTSPYWALNPYRGCVLRLIPTRGGSSMPAKEFSQPCHAPRLKISPANAAFR